MSNHLLYMCNYANDKYSDAQKTNTETAYKYGKVDKVFEYSPLSIPDFISQHPNLFAYKRGAGLWCWKPYIILKTLEKINDGDWLFYSDAGVIILKDIHIFTRLAESLGEDIILFQLDRSAKSWTKKETFMLLNVPEDQRDHNQILSGYNLWKKNDKTISFVKEWLELCLNETLNSPEKFDKSIIEDPEFIAHREDQSLLDILARKHGIAPFRDPSDFGITQKETIWRKLQPGERHSPYPVMLLSCRRGAPTKYQRHYAVKCIVWHLSLHHHKVFKKIISMLQK